MRGKAGPKPVKKDEVVEDAPLDPTAEEIAGEENVVDVGSAIEIEESDDEQGAPQSQGYTCSEPGCPFTSNLLSEMEEHVNGTGHGGYDVEEAGGPIKPQVEQAQLFSETIVERMLDAPLDEEFLNQKRKKLAEYYQRMLDLEVEKKAEVDKYNTKIKNIDGSMQEIARVLATPFERVAVKCEWHVVMDENCRKLFRLDNGEVVETKALTAEDRARELAQANKENEAAADAIPDDAPRPPADEPVAEPVAEEQPS